MSKTKGYGFAYDGNKDTLAVEGNENCYCQDGQVKSGIAFTPLLDVNGDVIRLASQADTVEEIFPLYIEQSGTVKEYLAIMKDGRAYYYHPTAINNAGAWVLFNSFGVKMKPLITQDETGKPRTYFCGENGIFYYTNAMNSTAIVKAKPIGCVYGGRVFVAVSDKKIVYSASFRFDEYQDTLSDSGHIFLPESAGGICAMAVYQNKLYVFCKYGIFEMFAIGDARDFTLKQLDYQGDRIFGNSVGVCVSNGVSGIYFYTSTGFCVFDGKTIKRICKNVEIQPSDDENQYHHAEYDGKYQLCYTTGWGGREALIINASTGEGYPTFATKGISTFHKRGYAVVGGIIGVLDENAVFPNVGTRSFSCRDVDFGEKGVKTLRTLKVQGVGQTLITVSDANDEHKKLTFNVALDGGDTVLKVFMRAERFHLYFEMDTERKGYIEYVEADYERLR